MNYIQIDFLIFFSEKGGLKYVLGANMYDKGQGEKRNISMAFNSGFIILIKKMP